MQNKNDSRLSGSKSNPLEDDDILEFAEEILGASTENIIDLVDESMTSGDDDEILDLTEMTDLSSNADDDIIDLTEELAEPQEESDGIIELEDTADASGEAEEEIFPLDDEILPEDEYEDEIIELGEVAEEMAQPEDGVKDLGQTPEIPPQNDTDPPAPSTGFTIENDTIELTEADRKILEEEFGFEPGAELQDEIRLSLEGEPDKIEEYQAGDDDRQPEVEIGETTAGAEPAVPTVEMDDSAAAPIEAIRLTDEDRKVLEEELGEEKSEQEETDDVTAPEFGQETPPIAGLETGEEEIGLDMSSGSLEMDADVTSGTQGAAQEEEISLDIEENWLDSAALTMEPESPPAKIDVTAEIEEIPGQEAPLSAGAPEESPDSPVEASHNFGFAEDEVPEPKPPEADHMISGDSIETIDFSDSDSAEKEDAQMSTGEDFEPSEALQVDFDPETEDPFADDAPPPGGDTAVQDAPLSAAGLMGENNDPDDSETPSFMGGLDLADENGAHQTDLSAGTEEFENGPELQGMTVKFDQPDSFERQDLHRVADPISIRVKEPETENHADEDTLLNRVFEPSAEAVSPEQIESVVEQSVKKLFSEKIEVILVEAIEKAVSKEIDRLKSLLLKDLGDGE